MLILFSQKQWIKYPQINDVSRQNEILRWNVQNSTEGKILLSL